MTDTDRVPYSYDDVFPERFLHAPDLDGEVTLTITDAFGEYIQNPKQKRKKERGDRCNLLAFKGTTREYVLSKQNAWILKTLWGADPAPYIGKHITLAPVPDSSGFTDHHTRILFVGSPDIDEDRQFTLPGGQQVTFRKTAWKSQTVAEGSVDPITGEVDDDSTPFDDLDDDIGFTDEAPHAAENDVGPAGDDSTASEGDDGLDGDIPGRGALFDAGDPKRPASNSDKKRLSEALAHVDGAAVKEYRKRFGGRGNSELTHGEAAEFKAWAVKEALA